MLTSSVVIAGDVVSRLNPKAAIDPMSAFGVSAALLSPLTMVRSVAPVDRTVWSASCRCAPEPKVIERARAVREIQ